MYYSLTFHIIGYELSFSREAWSLLEACCYTERVWIRSTRAKAKISYWVPTYHYIEFGYVGSLTPQHSEAVVSAHVRRNVLMYHGGAFANTPDAGVHCSWPATPYPKHATKDLPIYTRSTRPLFTITSSNHNYFFLSLSSCATTTSCSPFFLYFRYSPLIARTKLSI